MLAVSFPVVCSGSRYGWEEPHRLIFFMRCEVSSLRPFQDTGLKKVDEFLRVVTGIAACCCNIYYSSRASIFIILFNEFLIKIFVGA